MKKQISKIKIFKFSRDGKQQKNDEVIHEAEVVVRMNEEIHKFYCLPTDLPEMILGNLLSSGINPSLCNIEKISDNEFKVDLPPNQNPKANPQKCKSRKILVSKEVFDSAETLNANGVLFKRTGCTHVVRICGDKEIFAEDISRHCAIDKAIGLAIKNGIDLSNSFLVTSCRQTASTIKKTIFSGIPIVISISAPTDLVIKKAKEYGITLIGFADSERFNIYSQEWRIKT
jgi:FdhD protein